MCNSKKKKEATRATERTYLPGTTAAPASCKPSYVAKKIWGMCNGLLYNSFRTWVTLRGVRSGLLSALIDTSAGTYILLDLLQHIWKKCVQSHGRRKRADAAGTSDPAFLFLLVTISRHVAIIIPHLLLQLSVVSQDTHHRLRARDDPKTWWSPSRCYPTQFRTIF